MIHLAAIYIYTHYIYALPFCCGSTALRPFFVSILLQEWKSYVCQVSEAGICTTVGRLTPPYYDQLTAISSLGSVLYYYGPFLVELGDCTFVRRTFRNISVDHCSGLWRNSRLVVIGLVLVSSGVMLSLIFWLLFAREKKCRGYVKHFESDT